MQAYHSTDIATELRNFVKQLNDYICCDQLQLNLTNFINLPSRLTILYKKVVIILYKKVVIILYKKVVMVFPNLKSQFVLVYF